MVPDSALYHWHAMLAFFLVPDAVVLPREPSLALITLARIRFYSPVRVDMV